MATGLMMLFLSSIRDTIDHHDRPHHPYPFRLPSSFSPCPRLGSGEFLLIDEKNPEKVHLVVRTINSSAFSNEDWEEYVYEVSTPRLVPTDWWRTTILGHFGS